MLRPESPSLSSRATTSTGGSLSPAAAAAVQEVADDRQSIRVGTGAAADAEVPPSLTELNEIAKNGNLSVVSYADGHLQVKFMPGYLMSSWVNSTCAGAFLDIVRGSKCSQCTLDFSGLKLCTSDLFTRILPVAEGFGVHVTCINVNPEIRELFVICRMQSFLKEG